MSKPDYNKLYGTTFETNRSLGKFKRELFKNEDEMIPIYQNEEEKNDVYVGYESEESDKGIRLDSESESDEVIENKTDYLALGATFDEKSDKIQNKEKIGNAHVKWLGANTDLGAKETNENNELKQEKTVYRDKQGRIIDISKQKDKSEELKKINEERMREWKSGAEQVRIKENRRKTEEEEINKPFSRYEMEEDAETQFKQKLRFGDPAAFFRGIPLKRERMECEYSWENRFNIRPGYNWDGKDRSNGFERKWLAKKGRKQWENNYVYKQFASEL